MITPSIVIAILALISTQLLVSLGSSISPIPPTESQVTLTKVSLPPTIISPSEPGIKAQAVIAYDRSSGTTLYEKNADQIRPIASITKLATAVEVVSERDIEEVVTIPALPKYNPGDEIIGLQPGERYRIKDLLRALMVNSANDAADSLAIISSGSTEAFSSNMTEKVREWGINNAEFSNPSGLKDAGNGASARSVAKLGILALHNPLIEQLAATQVTSITSQSGRAIALEPTNQLLQTGRYKGIKTGYTLASGQCFIGLTKVQGREIVTVVLNSPDRFGETETLVGWVDRTYKWQ